jgi:hypothetical protein
VDFIEGGGASLPAGATNSLARRTMTFSKYVLCFGSKTVQRIFCVNEEVYGHNKHFFKHNIFMSKTCYLHLLDDFNHECGKLRSCVNAKMNILVS